MTDVSWYDVVKWSNAKSEMQGLTPIYYTNASFSSSSVYRTGRWNVSNSMVNWSANGYRLPTTAEWEKAARGGLIGKLYPNGDTLASIDANFNGTAGGVTPVKTYPPNGYGLYDMAGNVWQWCWDWVGGDVGISDPQGPITGEYRVVRSGSWNGPSIYCRVSFWGVGSLYSGFEGNGFRLVRRDPSLGTPF